MDATMTMTCRHCRAFNGRSRCGCAAARAERGETSVEIDLNSIVLPGFDADGRFLGRRTRGLR
jgi:hypothetical protein